MEVKSLGQEDPLEILLWKSYGQRRLGTTVHVITKELDVTAKTTRRLLKCLRRGKGIIYLGHY